MNGPQSTIVVDGPRRAAQLDLFYVTCWVIAGHFHPRRRRAGLRDVEVPRPHRGRRTRRAAGAGPRQSAGRARPDRRFGSRAGHHRRSRPCKGIWYTHDVPDAEKSERLRGHRDRLPVVVQVRISRASRSQDVGHAGHEQRARHSRRPAGPRQSAHDRRHPLLLGPEARRQGGHDPEPRELPLAARRTSPVISGASAPSTAATRMPSCASA